MSENLPDNTRLLRALDVTWAPAEMIETGGWVVRRGLGGGNRVSAASGSGDVAVAIDALTSMDQVPLFQLRPGQDALDADLESMGFRMHEPVVFYAAPVAELVGSQSHMAAAYRCHCRPAIMEEIWENGGIGLERLAIMDRVAEPKKLLLSRAGDRPAGTAFVALDGDVAMIHAIEVLPQYRRCGSATLLMEVAARFASEHGASWLALAVTRANTGARALYERLGMQQCGAYHYRIKTGDPT
ncbi:MAG: GNAT family N-acetyltransferase [Pseudomonadota bacterium]